MAPRARGTEPGGRVPPAPDSTWYTAQELDSYPRASTPIKIGPAARTATGGRLERLLLWLRIDEYGAVVDVSAGEPGIPARWVDLARAGLATVQFTPARKDDRAVKSRLLLSVNFAAAGDP